MCYRFIASFSSALMAIKLWDYAVTLKSEQRSSREVTRDSIEL